MSLRGSPGISSETFGGRVTACGIKGTESREAIGAPAQFLGGGQRTDGMSGNCNHTNWRIVEPPVGAYTAEINKIKWQVCENCKAIVDYNPADHEGKQVRNPNAPTFL